MTIKEDLHRLVDELPKKELPVAKRYLEYLRNMGDPVLRAFMEAPEDGEEETEEERALIQEARQEYLRGQARPWEDVREELAGE
jgi:CO dehydrogenase/acetyl-CoA synthase beta subunit